MALRHRTVHGVEFLTSEKLEALGVSHCFTTRVGGVSAGALATLNLGVSRGDDPENVLINYRRVADAAGLCLEGVVFSAQVHGDRVRVAAKEDAGIGLFRPAPYPADATVTAVRGITPVVFTADCTPILLCDPETGAVGAVHAGWRGTANGILEKAVAAMVREYGTRPGDLVSAIGPAIGPECFECGPEVAQAMLDWFGPEAEALLHRRGEKCFPDVKELNRLHLLRAGVDPQNIDVSAECTHCDAGRYWSHRRDGAARGSLAALITCGGVQ